MKSIVRPFIFALALFIIFEEWVWDTLKSQVKKLGSLKLFRWLDGRLRRLGPRASIAVFLLPVAVLLPFKLAAVWALSQGHCVTGLVVLLLAKLTGTAVAAYLFDAVRENARRIPWFDGMYVWSIDLLVSTRAWLQSQPSYNSASTMAAETRGAMKHLARAWRFKGRMGRKIRAAKAFVRAR